MLWDEHGCQADLMLYFFFFHSAEIIMLDGLTCVYRSNVDLFFYVMGSSNENEVRVINNCLKRLLLHRQPSENTERKFSMQFVCFPADPCKCVKCILRCHQSNAEEKCGKESTDGQFRWCLVNS